MTIIKYSVCSSVCEFFVVIKTENPRQCLISYSKHNETKVSARTRYIQHIEYFLIFYAFTFELATCKCRKECKCIYSLTACSKIQGSTNLRWCKMFCTFISKLHGIFSII